jgi:hypothetical protein
MDPAIGSLILPLSRRHSQVQKLVFAGRGV